MPSNEAGHTIDYNRHYYATHREQMKVNARKWQDKNRARYLARKRAYHEENREAISLAKRIGVSIPEARGMLKREWTQAWVEKLNASG